MSRRAALLVLLAVHAAACRPRAAPPIAPLAPALLELSEQAHRELRVTLPPRVQTERRLAELVERVRAELGPRPGRNSLDQLARLLFADLGYRREIDDKGLMPSLLPWVLQQRRGSCVGLGSLVLVLGQELGLPLEGVVVPGHFFVRYRGAGGLRGIELLKEGREMPESWYRDHYPWPRDGALYLRGLRPEETLAVVRFNLANALRERGALARAAEEYRRVVEVLPGLAEAQGNLGLVYHRLRDYARAEQAYRAAGRANRGLAGLQHNLEQLHRDWPRRD